MLHGWMKSKRLGNRRLDPSAAQVGLYQRAPCGFGLSEDPAHERLSIALLPLTSTGFAAGRPQPAGLQRGNDLLLRASGVAMNQ